MVVVVDLDENAEPRLSPAGAAEPARLANTFAKAGLWTRNSCASVDLMPTVLRIGSFRFHFYSDERGEPPHIHVRTPDGECKFWLEPIALASVQRVKPQDVRTLERLVFEHHVMLLSAYHEFHRSR
jgi:hypothetical protein